ncbi:hypothetical protein [Flammeovirga sp. SubArs3]|uniref:hypothetical protein n=1 Tax=Flammeovirga sp. SubArs3 TaxID=2995316 RepID=UPI00248C34B1|nr:hypothetical protein [Flammeovirga sp. SubArs3]
MQKHLYFVCPTDHLETIIEATFKEENYYYSSLGNSVSFEKDIISEINDVIETNNIKEVTFILSNTNKLILDAIQHESQPLVIGMKRFYYDVIRQKGEIKCF